MEKVPFKNLSEAGHPKEYTLEDLEKAQEELRLWEDRLDKTLSNNLNKFRSQVKDARIKIRLIKEILKASGVIEKTDAEKIIEALDKLCPNAKSKQIVTYEEKMYQIRYFPLDKSLSGKTVHEWGHEWRLIEKSPKNA